MARRSRFAAIRPLIYTLSEGKKQAISEFDLPAAERALVPAKPRPECRRITLPAHSRVSF